MDPDPFDERHPSRADPNCALGHMLKVLFRKDTFMNKVCLFCSILLLFHNDFQSHNHNETQTVSWVSSTVWSDLSKLKQCRISQAWQLFKDEVWELYIYDLCSLVLLDQTQAFSTTIRLNLRVLVIYPWFQHVFLVIKHSFSVKYSVLGLGT